MSSQTTTAAATSDSANSTTTQVPIMTNFDYGTSSVNSIAKAYDEKAHGPLCKRPAAIGEVCQGSIYDILASSGKSLFDKPSSKDKDAFNRLVTKAQESWAFAAAQRTKVGFTTPAPTWTPPTYPEVQTMTNFAPLTIDLSGLSMDASVLNFTIVLRQKGTPNNETLRHLDKARVFNAAAPVRAGMAISFAGIPVPIHAPSYDHGAINTDRIVRKFARTVRRAMNRAAFTLDNVLGLVARLYGKVATKAIGFGSTPTASATGTKTVNSRKVNITIARTARVRRQRRNAGRKQVVRYTTTEQRRDARKEQAAKLAAKQERRALVKSQLAAQHAANIAKLGVSQRTVFVKEVRQAPVTRTMKSAALRGNHDGVKYINGVDVPVSAKVIKTQRRIARRDFNQLTPAQRNRRFAAESNSKFQRTCLQAAGRALMQGQTATPADRLLSSWEIQAEQEREELRAEREALKTQELKVGPAPEVETWSFEDNLSIEEFLAKVAMDDNWTDAAIVEAVRREYPIEEVARLIREEHWFADALGKIDYDQEKYGAPIGCGSAAAGFTGDASKKAQEKAHQIMAASKAKYGAGDLQMSLNYDPTNGETNSLPFTPNGEEISMLNEIRAIFGESISEAVSISNTQHSSEPLGYAMGIAQIYISNRDIIHGNIWLPVRSAFSDNHWAKFGQPLDCPKWNFSSLVTPNEDYPVIALRAAGMYSAYQRQALFFMSKHWHRPSNFIKGKPEIQPTLLLPNDAGDLIPTNVVEGKTVKERLMGKERDVLGLRKKIHYATVMGGEYSDDYGNTVVQTGGLRLEEGRNVVFFLAEVSNFLGLDKQANLLFNVGMENGTVVGSETATSDAFNRKEGAHFGKELTYQRFITNSLHLFNIEDMSGVMNIADWGSKDTNRDKQLVFPVETSKKLAKLFFEGHPLLEEVDGIYAPFAPSSFKYGKLTEEAQALCDMLDMTPQYAIPFVRGGKATGKDVKLPPRNGATPPAPPVPKAKEEEEVVTATQVAPVVTMETEQVVATQTAPAVDMDAPAEPAVAAQTAPAVDMGASEPARTIEAAPTVVEETPEIGEYARQLAAYEEAVALRWATKSTNKIEVSSYVQGANLPWKRNVLGLGAKEIPFQPGGDTYAAFAAHDYLMGLTHEPEQDYWTAVDFSRVKWEIEHLEGLVEIIRSFFRDGKDTVAHWTVDDFGNKTLVIYGYQYVYVPGIGMMDSRGRLFKNLLQVNWLYDSKNNRAFESIEAINSLGNFLRLFYFGFLPMLANTSAKDASRIGANLNQLLNTCPDLFPMTSDSIMEDNSMVLWAESNAWAPIGNNTGDDTFSPIKKVGEKLAFLSCAGAMAKSLARQYAEASKDAKITGGDMAEQYVTKAFERFSMASSFNKGCLFTAPGFFTDLVSLKAHAPLIYSQLAEQVDLQCKKANNGFGLADLAKVMGISVDTLLAKMVVNNNQKASKGTKRILLRAPNVIQSGNVIDLEGKPKLRAMLEGGRGIKPRNTKWAGLMHKDFFGVYAGSKLTTQQNEAEGTLLRVAIGLTAVAPAGAAIFIGDPERVPHGFNNKISQGQFDLADRCKDKSQEVKIGGGHRARTIECPVDVEVIGGVLCGRSYTPETLTIRGVKYHYFIPNEPVLVRGNGIDTVCGVLTDDEAAPIRFVQHEKRNEEGVLEWIRYHVAPALSQEKELELEWSVTPIESKPKIRSVIAKAQLVYAKEQFLINSLNPRATRETVDVFYPNDVVKADTMVSMYGTIGATLVYNPDCTDPKFLAMRELAMDINEEVEGRRHLDYLVESNTGVAANPKYRKLSTMFLDYFKTTLWTNWQQLESGDFGQAMLRTYEDFVGLGKWYELSATEMDFLHNLKFAYDKQSGKFLGDLRVFVDDRNTTDTANIFVFAFKDGKVASIRQRCLGLIGKKNCPIYDVVMYERSTNKEGINSNPSGQMDVNVSSLTRVVEAAGIDPTVTYGLMQKQSEVGKEMGMMHAKMLTLMLSENISTAIPAAKPLTFGAWLYDQATNEEKWVADAVGAETLRQLTKNIDWNSPNHFGELCSVLKDYVITIQDPRKGNDKVLFDDYGNPYDLEKGQRRTVQLFTPFLYNLNGLSAENNSANTISGFFRSVVMNILDGKEPRLPSSKMIGMLESFATSEAVRKFISGDQTVGGKVLALPSCPTTVYMVTEGSDQWKEISRQASTYGYDLRDIPSWDEYLEHGENTWDVLPKRAEIFNHETRSPLADGSVARMVKLPINKRFLDGFFYSTTNCLEYSYENGERVGRPSVVDPYPYMRLIGVVAHTGMNKGDIDGDGTKGNILSYSDDTEKQALRALLTTFEFAWKYCEDSVGGKGKMAERGAYLGDHLAAPKASKKLAVYSQSDWLAIKKDPADTKCRKLGYAALMQANIFNRNNFRALIMQTTFVGVAYKVYRVTEALIDLIKGCTKAVGNLLLPDCLQWALRPDAAEVVKAVTELYEIILGATDDTGWDLWKSFYEKAMGAEFGATSAVKPFAATKVTTSAQPSCATLVKSRVPVLAKLMDDMGANSVYAEQVLHCLWFMSELNGLCKSSTLFNIEPEDTVKRNFELLLVCALMSVEAGRGKWSGYAAGTLNATQIGNKKDRHEDITRIVGNRLNGPAKETLYKPWAKYSHTMNVLMDMVSPDCMGDLVNGRLVLSSEEVLNESYTIPENTLALYRDRLAKRVGDIEVPEVVITYVDEEDLGDMPYDPFNDGIVGGYEDDDLSYLDNCPDLDDGYEGPFEDGGVIDYPETNTQDTPYMGGEPMQYPDEDEDIDHAANMPSEADLLGISSDEPAVITDAPLADPSTLPSLPAELQEMLDEEADLVDESNIPADKYLLGLEEEEEEEPAAPAAVAPVVMTAPVVETPPAKPAVITAPVVEAPRQIEVPVAPVVATELEGILSETEALEQEVATLTTAKQQMIEALQAAVAKEEEDNKRLAEAKAKRDALAAQKAKLLANQTEADAKIAELKAKLSPKYLAQALGLTQREITPEKPEDKDGGSPVVSKKPDPKPPAPPAPVVKVEPKAEPKAEQAPAKRTIASTTPVKTISLYTAASSKEGRGGWAFCSDDLAISGKGHACEGTCNGMGIKALTEALRVAIGNTNQYKIHSSNTYVLGGVWNGAGKQKANQELWTEFTQVFNQVKHRVSVFKGENKNAKKVANAMAAPCEKCGTTKQARVVQADLEISREYCAGSEEEITTMYRVGGHEIYSTTGIEKDDKGISVFWTDEANIGWVRSDVNPDQYAKLFGFDPSWDYSKFTVYVGSVHHVDKTSKTVESKHYYAVISSDEWKQWEARKSFSINANEQNIVAGSDLDYHQKVLDLVNCSFDGIVVELELESIQWGYLVMINRRYVKQVFTYEEWIKTAAPAKPVTDYKEFLTTAKEGDLTVRFDKKGDFAGYELDGKPCGVLVYEDEDLLWFERPDTLFIYKGHEHTGSVEDTFDGSIHNEETLETIFPIYIGELVRVYEEEKEAPAPTTADLQDTLGLLKRNNEQLETLGWSLEEARAQLQSFSGVGSRKELTNTQLADWVEHCEGLTMSNNEQVAELFANYFTYQDFVECTDTPPLPGETLKEYLRRDPDAEVNLDMLVSECDIFRSALKGKGSKYATPEQYFQYLWDTRFVDHIFRCPGFNAFDLVDEFNKTLKHSKAGLDRQEHKFWDGDKSVGLDIMPDNHQVIIGRGDALKIIIQDYPEILDLPVACYWDACKKAIINANYSINTDYYPVDETEEITQFMFASWMHLARTGEVVEVDCDWSEEIDGWVYSSALAKKHNEEQTTKESDNMTEATAKKLQGQKRPINPPNPIEKTSNLVPITSKSSLDRSCEPVPADSSYTPCQQRFFDVACTGSDVFLAGAPGNGKTYATERIARHWLSLGDKVIITATTGRAVMNLGCMFDHSELAALGTLNSVLRLGIDFGEQDRIKNKISAWSWANTLVSKGRNEKALATLLKAPKGQRVHFIIDEVSMLDARLLWVVVNILRAHNPAIQIILVGDGNQLQPVSKKDDPATVFWKTPKFAGCSTGVAPFIDQFKVIWMTTNVRQADDVAFKAALDHLAETNELSGVILERVEGCMNGTIPMPDPQQATHIRYNNLTVARINEAMTNALVAEKRVYKAAISNGSGAELDYVPGWVNDFSPIQASMTIGVGMPVKLRRNRKDENNILEASNGSRGIVTKLGDKSIWVKFENGKELEIKPETFEGGLDKYGNSKGTFKQLPLHPDYATTGHSCQGLTITNPVVIGVYQEWRVFAKGKETYNTDGSVRTRKVSIKDAEWLLVVCSRVPRADLLFFDFSDPNALNLLVDSMGNKNTEYFEWLASKDSK